MEGGGRGGGCNGEHIDRKRREEKEKEEKKVEPEVLEVDLEKVEERGGEGGGGLLVRVFYCKLAAHINISNERNQMFYISSILTRRRAYTRML